MSDDSRGGTLFVAGPSRSGKSALMWALYTSRAPRILTVEVVEETAARPDAIARERRRTFGYADTVTALRECASHPRWHVIASLDRDEVERVMWLLCPKLRAADTIGYARAVGGMVLACGELQTVAPTSLKNDSAVLHAYLRYAHYWLTIHGATQHAPDCAPCTRMSADRCVFLPTQDDLGLQAVQRATSRAVADVVATLPRYHSATCIKSEGLVYLADARYCVYRVMDYRGTALSPRSEGTPGSTGVSTTGENGRHGRAGLAGVS